MKSLPTLLLTSLMTSLLLSTAQVTSAQDAAATTDGEPQAENLVPSTPTPALFSVGISGGFPSYQTVALSVSLQSSFVGLQAKGSWTAVGPFLGLQLRGYPPVPIPVPVYLGLGVGIYGPNVSFHAALGAHVPLARALRLDLEAGLASVPLLDQRSLAPHVAVGVSYAVPLQLQPNAGRGGERIGRTIAERPQRSPEPTCAAPVEPVPGALADAVDTVVDQWLDSARATYGSVYTDLNYSYSITSSSVTGSSATVKVSYSGSVREIANGRRHEASGTATAEFGWNGCNWVNRGVSY